MRNNFVLSDKYLKTNIEPISSATETIKSLNPVVFNWKDRADRKEIYADPDQPERMPQYGVIAQEIAEVLPELVVQNARNFTLKNDLEETEIIEFMGVDYEQLIPILIKSSQEQQQVIESQQTQIDDLKEMVQNLINKDNDSDESPEET